ncbi:unnamed protein product, partial [Closterium sp. NIES-54]
MKEHNSRSFTNQQFSMASIATAIGTLSHSLMLHFPLLPFLSCPPFTSPNPTVQFLGISVGSILLGILVSLLCALILRFIDINSEFSKFELSLVLVSGYLSYSVAEMLSLSGIMALFFCGICNAHYGYYNISHASKISSKYAFEALSFMAEMFVFAYLGMQVVVMQHVIDWGLLLSAIPLCLLSRAFNVFPLSFLSNCT